MAEVFPVIFPLTVFGIVVLAVYWQVYRAKKMRELLKALAPRLGLRFLEGAELLASLAPGRQVPSNAFVTFLIKSLSPWRMEGQRSGLVVSIFPERRGSGKNSTTYTIVRAEFGTPASVSVLLLPEGGFERFAKSVFNMQDIEIGDERFDRAFMIRGEDPAGVKLFLDPERREKFLHLKEKHQLVRITEKFVQYEKAGTIVDEQKLRTVLEDVTAAAL